MYISAYFSLVEYIRLYSLTLPSIGTILKNTNGAKGHLTAEWEIIPRGLAASFSLYMIRNRDRALAKRITATNGIPFFPKINAHGLALFCSGYIYRPIIPIYLRVTFIALGITRKRVNETQQEIVKSQNDWKHRNKTQHYQIYGATPVVCSQDDILVTTIRDFWKLIVDSYWKRHEMTTMIRNLNWMNMNIKKSVIWAKKKKNYTCGHLHHHVDHLCFNTLRPRQNGRRFAEDTF